jgi:hypothetical protein
MLFSIKEKKDLASKLANYCTFKNMLGAGQFRKELFSINKFRLKENIAVYANGKIGKSLFKQIVSNAASLKQLRWAEKFVEEYAPLLFEEYRESMKSLAMAYIYFNSGKYDKVLESINKFKSADVADKMQVKNLVARTYYEMREFESLIYHIDSTVHFLKKNKDISDYLRQVNGKFLDYLQHIVSAIEKRESEKLCTLEADIRNDNKVNYKVWLLEKLTELE